ncbi:hypothetical protein [Verrucosispora sp. ts21]|uniref:hypothetical protein n=1 Tax=Verrucosispora sp. ts21 TaxID=2069341 RepID=UPI0011AF2043|nr:hypothetical protein [Verrucosispora sp. ts21]
MTITITNYRDLFANIRKRPRMWLIREDFASVVAFVEGCNQATARTLLTGFSHGWWLKPAASTTTPGGASSLT